MGQPITVTEKPPASPGVVRFETNRTLTGMGHDRYASADDATGDRVVDELARRLFATGKVARLHVYSNQITVDLAKGTTAEGLAEIIHGLFVHYVPGVVPPTDEELMGGVASS